MSNLTEALEIACRVHRGQTDKAGAEYIRHVLAVVRMCAGDEDAEIVAALHDCVEDFKGSGLQKIELLHEIRTKFGDVIYDAVMCLTHDIEEPYRDYIERVAENHLATKVKCADLTHNQDPRRIPAHQLVDKDFKRWNRYRVSLIRLQRGEWPADEAQTW